MKVEKYKRIIAKTKDTEGLPNLIMCFITQTNKKHIRIKIYKAKKKKIEL